MDAGSAVVWFVHVIGFVWWLHLQTLDTTFVVARGFALRQVFVILRYVAYWMR